MIGGLTLGLTHMSPLINLFFHLLSLSGSRIVVMENNDVAPMLGVSRINLKLTSEKTLILQDVHHVPEIRRNLISGSLLVQQRFKLVFDQIKL